MQSNNVKHREKSTSAVLFDVRALILTLVITMTMVVGTALFASSIAYAQTESGATVRVATFDQLNDALGNGGVSDIIIDPQAAEEFADDEEAEISFDGSDVFYIPIEYPLVVSHDVTISSEVAVNFARSGNGGSGKYDSKAFRGQNEITPALFNVDQGKTLELSGDIAMTGEEVSATFDSAEGSFLFTVKARDNLGDDEDGNEAWSYGSDPGKLSTGGYFIYTKGGNVVMNDGILLMGLNTKDNVKDIAPVYIDGTAKAATLTVDGAEIYDNNLGQTEDGNSTAGAVILKGSNATAALNSGVISNNNADVAGIIVKEEAELELGNDFGINDSDIYDEKAEEEAAEEDAAEETKEEAKEETKEETKEEAPTVVAPKKSLKSSKSSAVQMRSAGNQTATDQTPKDTETTVTVATSSQLKAALANPKVTTIIVDKTGALKEVSNKDANGVTNPQVPEVEGNGKFYLPVDEPLTIAKGSSKRTVTIKTKDNNSEAIIARSEEFKATNDNPAIFNVPSGVELILDSKITMTGDKVTSAYKYSEDKNLDGDATNDSGFDAGKEYKAGNVTFANSNLRLNTDGSNSTNVKMKDTGKEFWLEDGLLVCDHNGVKHYLAGQTGANLKVATKGTYTSANAFDRIEVRDAETEATITSLSGNQSYVLYDVRFNKYLKSNGSDGFSYASGLSDAMVFTSGAGTGSSAGQAYAPVKFKFTATKKTVSGNNNWTANDVKDGGFFVNVNGGKLTIKNNVTIGGIETGPYVKNVAPIVVKNGGEFEMQGGTIKDNRIGYGGDRPDCPSSEADIQTLKEYLNFTTNDSTQTNKQLTNTAGAIIFEGANTNGKITGGSINGNLADCGAIIVKDGAFVAMGTSGGSTSSPSISKNTGFHHAGAVLVENGGTFHMLSGKMSENVTWNRGGAVFATEWGTAGLVKKKNGKIQNFDVVYSDKASGTKKRTGGNFIMDGGTLENNMAFVRGGAINVESDGVILRNGTIEGNRCKSLGGAIYVEGDDPDYSYTLTINNGYIGGNTAIKGAHNNDKDSGLDVGIGTNGGIVAGTQSYGGSYHKDGDFPNLHSGNGGGVWLCPLGGTSVFASSVNDNNNKVIIDNNESDHSGKSFEKFGYGDDFYLSRGKGAALVQNLLGKWEKDNGTSIGTNPSGLTLNGPLGLVNKGKQSGGNYSASDAGGIKIIKNLSRDGGGIAADGTVLLGKSDPVYRFHTELKLKKLWDTGLDAKDVTLALNYEYNGEKYPLTVTGDDSSTIKYSVTLIGSAATDVTEDMVMYEDTVGDIRTAKAFIPQYVEHKISDTETKKVPIYRIRKPNTTGDAAENFFDLSTPDGIKALYEAVGNNKSKDFDVEWNLWVTEKIGNQNNKEYAISQYLENNKVTVSTKTTAGATLTDPLNPNQKIATVDVNFSTVGMTYAVRNSQLTKKNAGKDAALSGAEFAVYRAKVGGPGSGGYSNGAIFVENSRGTSYGDDASKIAPINSEAIITAADGKIAIDSLEPGTYLMFETKAPAGYERAKSPWFIHVSSTGALTIVASDVFEGQTVAGDDIYNTSGNTYEDRIDSLNSWVQNKYWYKSGYNLKGESDNLSAGKTVDDVVIQNRHGTTLTDKVLTNKPFKVYKKNDDNPATPLDNIEFEVYGAQVQDGKLKYGNQLHGSNGTLTTSNGGVLDLSKSIYFARTNGTGNGWGTKPSESITGLANTNVLMLKEKTTSDTYRTPTVPWLIIYNYKTGSIELKEYEDKYTTDASPWDYTKFSKTIALYNSGTTVTTGNSTIVNEKNLAKITLTKYGAKTFDSSAEKTYLNGVVFTLYEAANAGDEGAVNNISGISGYVKEVKNDITTSGTGENTGKVEINNLTPGKTYYLKETTPHDGYIKPDKAIRFKISRTEGSTTFDWNEDLDNAESEIILKCEANVTTELKVGNKELYDLPKAGGMGTYWFMIIGAMMMGFALTAAFTKMDLLALFRR